MNDQTTAVVAAKPRKYTRSPLRGSKPGEHRGGRAKGTPNKLTGDVKAMILAALDKVGGPVYLVEQAGKNPTAFLTLVGKVLPLQVTGRDGGPLETRDVTAMTPDERRAAIRDLLAKHPELVAMAAIRAQESE